MLSVDVLLCIKIKSFRKEVDGLRSKIIVLAALIQLILFSGCMSSELV